MTELGNGLVLVWAIGGKEDLCWKGIWGWCICAWMRICVGEGYLGERICARNGKKLYTGLALICARRRIGVICCAVRGYWLGVDLYWNWTVHPSQQRLTPPAT